MRLFQLSIFMSVFFLVYHHCAWAWDFAHETEGIKIYTQKKEGSEIREVKAMAFVDAPPSRVFKVIGDYNHFKDFMPYTKESKIIAQQDKVTYFYTLISPPIVSNRDYTLKLTDYSTFDGKTGFYKVVWEAANDKGPPQPKGVVRLDVNRGFWLLESTEGGKKTFVTYYLYTDPAGAIPLFLVNQANKESVPDLIKAVRKRVKDKMYDEPASKPIN